MAAIRYASHTDDPVLAAASPGSTKIPLPSIPPILIAITAGKANLLSNFFKILFYIYKNTK
jgi:hypothetical protein